MQNEHNEGAYMCDAEIFSFKYNASTEFMLILLRTKVKSASTLCCAQIVSKSKQKEIIKLI